MSKVVFICAALPKNIDYLKSAILSFKEIKIYLHDWYLIRTNRDGKSDIDQLKFETETFLNSIAVPIQEGIIISDQFNNISDYKALTRIANDALAIFTKDQFFDQREYQEEIIAIKEMLQFSKAVYQQPNMTEIENYYSVQLRIALYSILNGENIFFTSKIMEKILYVCFRSIVSDIKNKGLPINFDTSSLFSDEDKFCITNVSNLSFDEIIILRNKLKNELSDLWLLINDDDGMNNTKSVNLNRISKQIDILQKAIRKKLGYKFPKMFLKMKNFTEISMLLHNNILVNSELASVHSGEKTGYKRNADSKVFFFYMDNNNLNDKQNIKSVEREIEDLGILLYNNSKTLITLHRERIFFSYSSKDVEWVRKISNALNNYGFNIWIDKVEMDLLKDDKSIKKAISNGIAKSDIFLVLLSSNSINSKWVKYEISGAFKAYQQSKIKNIIVAIIDNIKIPYKLDHWEIADFRKDFEDGMWSIRRIFDYTDLTKRKDSDSCSTAPKNSNTVNFKEIHPDSRLCYKQGLSYLNHDDRDSAIRCFDKAFSLHDQNYDALYNATVLRYDLAIKEVDSEKKTALFQRVINDYEKLIISNPKDVDAMVNLVSAYRHSKSGENTHLRQFRLLTKAREIRPDYYLVWENMGYLFKQIISYKKLHIKNKQLSMKGSIINLELIYLIKAKQCFMNAAELFDGQDDDTKHNIIEIIREIDNQLKQTNRDEYDTACELCCNDQFMEFIVNWGVAKNMSFLSKCRSKLTSFLNWCRSKLTL